MLLTITSDFIRPSSPCADERCGSEDILYGAGAHPTSASRPCVRCADEPVPDLQVRARTGEHRDGVDDPMCLAWWKNARLDDHPYLAADPGAALRGRGDYPVPETEDVKEDVERCCALVESRGLEMLVLDQTRPDIGLPVARVIAGTAPLLGALCPGAPVRGTGSDGLA